MEIIPKISISQSQKQFNAACATEHFQWFFVGSEDGTIKKYNFLTSPSKSPIHDQSKHSHYSTVFSSEPVVKNATLISSWKVNEYSSSSLIPYSMSVHKQAHWGLVGLNNGTIGLFLTGRIGMEGKIHFYFTEEHSEPISALSTSLDEQSFISASWDSNIKLWDLNAGKCIESFNQNNTVHKSQISSVNFHPASPFVFLSSSIDGVSAIWDARISHNANVVFTIQQRQSWTFDAVWGDASGTAFYSAKKNGAIQEWSLMSSEFPVNTFKLPLESGPVTRLRYLSKTCSLLIASHDSIRVLNLLRNSPCIFQIIPGHHGGTISNLVIDCEEKYLISTSGNRGWEGTCNYNTFFYEICSSTKSKKL